MPAFAGVTLIYPNFDGLVPGENPLSDGGRWGPYHTRPQLKVDDGGGAIHGTVEFAVNGSLYKERAFTGPDIEAYGCRPDSGLGAALESHRIVALSGDPNVYTGFSSGYGGGIGQEYFFRKYTAFAFIGIGGSPGLADDDPTELLGPEALGIRILPDRVEQWGYNSGFDPTYNPEWAPGWMLVRTHFESIPQQPWRFALETEEQGGIEEVGWTCFGASVVNDPEFLLWMPSAAPAGSV